MFKSSKTFAPKVPGTIDLEISDPVLMLNEVAKRYETTERVLMEYVDNALDDAETLYRENGDVYPYPIHIDIAIDRANRAISVQDNCRGMTRDTLERIVRNIGESQKRGQTWVNGRFGFGVHAFRAAAGSIAFQSKHELSSHHGLSLLRDQHRGIKEAKRRDEPFPTDSGSGCIVTISDFDHDWFQSVTIESIKAEIEKHFERLIARPGLQIVVDEDGLAPLSCQPFDYAAVEGTEIKQNLHLEYKDADYAVEMRFKIANQPLKRPASFFARGRRIGDVVDIKSFMRKSLFKTSVWNHPNLIGYIEVGEIVQPIINRDDFVRTRGRTILYEALLPVETEIRPLLASVNKQRRENTYAQFEHILQQTLAEAADDSPGFDIQFDDASDEERRGWLEDGRLTININHPDFQTRLRTTRQGNPRPSDRLNAYLAALLSVYGSAVLSPEQGQQDAEQRLAAQLDLMVMLESQLRELQRN